MLNYWDEMKIQTLKTFYANIYIGSCRGYSATSKFTRQQLEASIRRFQNQVKLCCVTITETFYLAGEYKEDGWIVGLMINSRRFSEMELQVAAMELARWLLNDFEQNQITIQFPDETMVFTYEEQAKGGLIPKSSDTVPAMIDPGMSYVSPEAAKRIGLPMLQALNQPSMMNPALGEPHPEWYSKNPNDNNRLEMLRELGEPVQSIHKFISNPLATWGGAKQGEDQEAYDRRYRNHVAMENQRVKEAQDKFLADEEARARVMQ